MSDSKAHDSGFSSRLDGAAYHALDGVIRGDTSALDALLRLCWDSVVSYAAGITGTVDSGEDVAQETFVRLWENRSAWAQRGAASLGLIYRIARNLALNHVRAGTRRERHLVLYREEQEAQSHDEPEWGEAALLRDAVRAAIDELPERRREIFLLARFHGLSYDEIAEAMGISRQTVANQMSAALNTLRETLGHLLDAPAVPAQRRSGVRLP